MKMPVQVRLILELHRLETNGNGIDEEAALRNLAKRMDPSLLKLYRRLKERRGTGTAILQNGMCSACMFIYPKTHEMLRCKNTIHFCEFCGRLLVVTEDAA